MVSVLKELNLLEKTDRKQETIMPCSGKCHARDTSMDEKHPIYPEVSLWAKS